MANIHDFNVNNVSYKFYSDKLYSLEPSANLIIESSYNSIEFKTNKKIIFNNDTIFNYGLNMKDKEISGIDIISTKTLNVGTIFLPDLTNVSIIENVIDNTSLDYGYIRETSIGYDPSFTGDKGKDGGRSFAYFTYINVSGGDSSFNDSVYIQKNLLVEGSTTIGENLIVNQVNYVSLYNNINQYITSIGRDLSTSKILTIDMSATNISISNDLYVYKSSILNNVNISGELVNNVLKVPNIFTIDPSGFGNNSGTLFINGDLKVYGNRTSIESNIIEISNVAIRVASNLSNRLALQVNNAGLDISNVASLKYDGSIWKFVGGDLLIENKKACLDVSLIDTSNAFVSSLNTLKSFYDSSYTRLKKNMDDSFNVVYTRNQTDLSFVLKSASDTSFISLISYIDNSYVSVNQYDASFSALRTYLDASYVLKKSFVDGGTYARIGQIIQGGSLNSYSVGAVSINDDGNIVAIGAVNNVSYAGSVRVYRYNDISWTQISQTFDGFASNDGAGTSISLNSAGNILAFGAPYSNNSTGYVRVYRYVNDSSWIQISQTIYGNSVGSSLGWSVSLNSNGTILAITASTNNYLTGSAIVYRYINDSSWIQISQIIECDSQSQQRAIDRVLYVSLNSSGNILAFGIPTNSPGGLLFQGTVRIYRYINDSSWTQISQNINGDAYNYAGYSASLNSSGNIVAIGYPFYSQINSNTPGLVRVFRYVNDTSWTQVGLDIVGEGGSFTPWVAGDTLGLSLSLNSSGNILAIGAPNNDINGNNAGLIRIYKYNDVSWVRLNLNSNIQDMSVNGYLGTAVAINAQGNRVIAGAPRINNGYSIVYDYPLISTVDSSLSYLSGKLDLSYVSKRAFDDSYNDLVSKLETSFNRISIVNLDTSSITIEAVNTKHFSQRFSNILWNQLGQDISNGLPLTNNNNNKIAISNDGKVVAMSSSSHRDISKGRVYVYEISYNQTSIVTPLGLSGEILVGVSNDDQFGWDIALSSDGKVVAGSSILNDSSGVNSGQVRVFELSNNIWRQKGNNINGSRINSESGYSISLTGNGNSIAVGAWKDDLNGTNAGAVRVYDFSSSINEWRIKGSPIIGIGGSYEGSSSALSLDGLTLASGSITGMYRSGTGGFITNNGSYTIHSFTTVGTFTFTPTFNGTVEVLIVGGGGGGGRNLGGGGGGGGVIYIPAVSVTAGSGYSIEVGDGGPSGTDGQPSKAFTAIAAGGGSSGSYDIGIGRDGGCGGGAAANNSTINKGGVSSGNSLGTNTGTIYGEGGGHLTASRDGGGAPTRAAGGGGAGGQGLYTNPSITGDTGQTGAGSGGVGIVNSILGTSYYWAGGGGGAAYLNQTGGWGGLGGGGGGSCGAAQRASIGGGYALNAGNNGLIGGNTNGGAGGANTGGGGGGGAYSAGLGGKGGSGIVVIRYLQEGTGQVKTFTWSGTTWVNKGIIQGADMSNSYFGRTMKLSGNGNNIIIGAPRYSIITKDTEPIYELNTDYKLWDVHRRDALASGKSLAVILNPEQNERVRLLLGNTSAYLGGRRTSNSSTAGGKTSADWQWVTGDIWSYTNFENNEPNTIAQQYIQMYTNGKWDDIGDGNMRAIYMTSPTIILGQASVYSYQGGTTWTQLGQTITGISGGDEFGSNLSISNDGTTISVGGRYSADNNSRCSIRVFKNYNNYWYQLGQTISGSVNYSMLALNHALSGDGTTLFHNLGNQSSRVYGINKTLILNAPFTTISGNLVVLGNSSLNSLDISKSHVYTSSGYNYKVFDLSSTTASMKEYYSNVTSTKHLKLQIVGNGFVYNINNSYQGLSDCRLKENIVTSGPKLDDLLKVRVVNYNLKDSDNTKYIGVLAQELEEVFPNLVTELEPSPKDIEDGRTIKYKAVNYSSFDAILIKSLQEQNAILNNITKRIEALENK
jgi:hypothetical protein